MTPGLAISIINYRTADLTIAALDSVRDALGDRPARVVVVDNASGDGSAEAIEDWIEAQGDARLTLVRSPTNSGFSGGHNQGMAAAKGAAFYLILNSDALLRPGFFEAILAAAGSHPEAGLFEPQIEHEDGRVQHSCFRFATPTSELIRGAQSGPVTRLLDHRVVALPLPPDQDAIEWASFACILLRSEMVRAIGPMDEGYFLYFEDSEYCLRARRAGWKIVHVPQARAVHHHGMSGPLKELQTKKKRLPEYYWRSRARFLAQAHGPFGPLLGNLAWILGRVIAHGRLLAGRSVPPSHEREWCDIWTGTISPLRLEKQRHK